MSDEDRAIAAEHGGSFVEETRGRGRVPAPPRRPTIRRSTTASTTWSRIRPSGSCSTTSGGSASAPDFGPRLHEAWTHGYVPVNEAFAAATLEELDREPDAAVLFHDYHLYLAPRPRARGAARGADVALRPHPVAGAGLLARAPRRAARRDPRGSARERRRRLPHRPLARRLPPLGGAAARRPGGCGSGTSSIAAADARRRASDRRRSGGVRPRCADDPAVLEREAALVAGRPEQLVVRVDRIDPSKNIVRGFEAFALLLERHPELHGKVAMARPARTVAGGHPGVRRVRGRRRAGCRTRSTSASGRTAGSRSSSMSRTTSRAPSPATSSSTCCS